MERQKSAVRQKVGVICKNCGERIEVEDEYIPGIRGAEMAASLYQPAAEKILDFVNRAWRKKLMCVNPDCRQVDEYTVSDLLLYNDHPSK